ncbi:MAG TPA: hypothetical protein VK571_05390 [Gemmatimonadaceae bacterium]|nr:hypothetical protein [Gemmatimonadaceae bacterium]
MSEADCPLCGWVSTKHGKLCKRCGAAYDKYADTCPDSYGDVAVDRHREK